MNAFRKSEIHLIVFFIFLVANIGGSLTPLGDPPLFLGFLQGVGFFWTFALFPEMLFVSSILLFTFFVWDTYMFRKEGWHDKLHLIETHVDAPDDLIDDVGLPGVAWLMSPEHGAVFFGAVTYIGHAPNFMVKAIAERSNVKMPSFFGFMFYSVLILVPIFILTTFIFF